LAGSKNSLTLALHPELHVHHASHHSCLVPKNAHDMLTGACNVACVVTAGRMGKTMRRSAAPETHQDGTDQPNGKDSAQFCYTNKHQDGRRLGPMACPTLLELRQSILPYSTMYSTWSVTRNLATI